MHTRKHFSRPGGFATLFFAFLFALTTVEAQSVPGDAGPRRFRAGTTGAHRATGYLARRPRVIRGCVWRIAAALN